MKETKSAGQKMEKKFCFLIMYILELYPCGATEMKRLT